MDKRNENSYLSADIQKLIVRKNVKFGGDTETSFSLRGAKKTN